MPEVDIVDPLLGPPKLEPVEISGCSLQCIRNAAGSLGYLTGQNAAWNKSRADRFDELCRNGHGEGGGYKGRYFTGTIVTIADSSYNGADVFKATEAELLKRGFKLLATYPGAHRDIYGQYKMYLYGSSSFELPGESNKEKK